MGIIWERGHLVYPSKNCPLLPKKKAWLRWVSPFGDLILTYIFQQSYFLFFVSILTWEPVCDRHDCCYSTCGSKKSFCDNEFKQGLLDACEKNAKNKSTDIYVECLNLAILFVDTVQLFGAESFKEQRFVCRCVWVINYQQEKRRNNK